MPLRQTVHVERGDADLVAVTAKFALPERFTADITPNDPDVPATLEDDGSVTYAEDRSRPRVRLDLALEDGRAVCNAMTITRQDGGPIDSNCLRSIPVAEYIAHAVDRAGHYIARKADVLDARKLADLGNLHAALTMTPMVPFDADNLEDAEFVTVELHGTDIVSESSEYRGPRDRSREVGDIYKRAHARGDRPAKAVAEHFTVSPSMASKLIRRAREEGHLGPAQQGRATT